MLALCMPAQEIQPQMDIHPGPQQKPHGQYLDTPALRSDNSTALQPKVICEAPPGGASTRDELRPVM